jgi:hypothetical protein
MTSIADAGTTTPGRSQTSTSSYAPRDKGELAGMIRRGARRDEISAFLASLKPSLRVEQVLEVQHGLVGKLYDAVGGAEALALEDIVPTDERGTIILEGRNSLPSFTRFQKRFTRVGDTLVGYNHQLMSFVTGPGYFVVRPPTPGESHPDELFFDYTTDPPSVPAGWPAFKANDAGLSRLVYMNMKDFCRRVGPGVLVGKAYKRGVAQNAYFTLTRPY